MKKEIKLKKINASTIERQLEALKKLMVTVKFFMISQVFLVFFNYIFYFKNLGIEDPEDLSCHSLFSDPQFYFMNAIIWFTSRLI